MLSVSLRVNDNSSVVSDDVGLTSTELTRAFVHAALALEYPPRAILSGLEETIDYLREAFDIEEDHESED